MRSALGNDLAAPRRGLALPLAAAPMTVTVNLTKPYWAAIVTGIGPCIVDALDHTPSGAPTRQCLLVPSQVIAWDNCDCGGQVALAIRQVYGSKVFPTLAPADTWVKCGPNYWVADVLVSV